MNQKLRGFVAQGMNGRRPKQRPHLYKLIDSTTPGAGSFTAILSGYVEVYAWAGGGSGLHTNGGSARGGAAGGAFYRRVPVHAGQVLSWTLGAGGAGVTLADGNAGGDTTVRFPDGLTGRALGGGGGVSAGAVGGTGAGGADALNRKGGNGSPSPTAGEDGGGSAGTGTHGGGGAPGFASIITGLAYTSGGNDNSGTSVSGFAAGSGGCDQATGGGGSTGNGGNGRLLAYFYE